MDELIVFASGFLAAFIGAMSGGGAGFIALFGLLLVGMPIQSAIATYRMADLGLYVGSFPLLKNKGVFDGRLLVQLLVFSLVGMTVGTLFVVELDPVLIRRVIILVMFIALIATFITSPENQSKESQSLVWVPAYLGATVYTGLIGAGGGPIYMIVLMKLRGLSALKSMANLFVSHFFAILWTVVIFSYSGLIDYYIGGIMLISHIIGGALGARISTGKGNGFIKLAMQLVIVLTLLKLVFFE